MERRGFKRLHLKAGQKETVEFRLTPREPQMLDRDMHWVVEPGLFGVLVGSSSDQKSGVSLQVVGK
jgi:beta-glucosidase